MDKHDHKHNKRKHDHKHEHERKESAPRQHAGDHHYPGQPIATESGPEEKEKKKGKEDRKEHHKHG